MIRPDVVFVLQSRRCRGAVSMAAETTAALEAPVSEEATAAQRVRARIHRVTHPHNRAAVAAVHVARRGKETRRARRRNLHRQRARATTAGMMAFTAVPTTTTATAVRLTRCQGCKACMWRTPLPLPLLLPALTPAHWTTGNRWDQSCHHSRVREAQREAERRADARSIYMQEPSHAVRSLAVSHSAVLYLCLCLLF